MKIRDYSKSFLTPEVVELLDDIQTLLNFGKYQWPVVAAAPTWVGRQGEQVLYISGATTRLYVCTSDLSATSWLVMVGT